MQILCKNCKHWRQGKIGVEKSYNVYDLKKEEPMFYENSGQKHILPFGRCKCKMMIYGEGYSVDVDNGDITIRETSALYYMDSEQYGAYILTGEDFGCVHGEIV
jgi:hypothetical protein